MKENFFFYKKEKFILIFVFILVTATKLKFFDVGYWYDEWHTFFYSNPYFLKLENFNKLINNSSVPPLFFLIASLLHKLFGYSPEAGRFFSMFFDFLSLVTLYFLVNKNFFQKVNFFILLFFLLNYSLILYSIELRFYSFYVFVTLGNVYLFFNYFNNQSNINFIKYFFFSLFALSSNYFLIPIILIQFLYFFLKKKIFIYKVLLFLSLFVSLNFTHLTTINELNSQNWWGDLNISFFLGYYFNIFFGSKLLGGLVLVLMAVIFAINFKKIKSNEKLVLLIFFILSTYLFFIVYSFILTPVLRPRYFLHLVPLILCVMVIMIFMINSINIRNSILVFFTLFHVILLIFFSLPFLKPDTNKLADILESEKFPLAVDDLEYTFINKNNNLSEIDHGSYPNLYFINHLVNLERFKNLDLNFISKKKINEYKIFLEICQNNPDYSTKIPGDDLNCLKNNYYKFGYKIIKQLKTRDFIVNKYQKIS